MSNIADASHSEAFVRQLGIYNPADSPDHKVHFVGLGGIGSFAALAVAKLGVPHIVLQDHDEVERHNLPNQFYTNHHIGYPKVTAMGEAILDHAPMPPSITMLDEKATRDTEFASSIVVSGLDSMEARTEVWEAIKLKPQVQLYLDGRISGQFIIVYAVNPTDLDEIDSYESTLYSDDSAEDISCTERGIIDVGFQVGALIALRVRQQFTHQEVPRINMMNMPAFTSTTGDYVKVES